MATSLVTGGLGFIGSHIAEALVREGHRVRILDNLDTGKHENIAEIANQVELITGSVTDDNAVAAAMQGVDYVFHQAALASVPRSLDAPLDTHAVCATGTLIVLDQARRQKVKRVVYAASSSAYGNPPESRPKRETDTPLPLSPYGVAKLTGELYCRAFYPSFGLETVALRYFNVFGPRQDPNGPYAAVIPRFIEAMLVGQQPKIFGDGTQSRDFTSVENVVAANLAAMRSPTAAGEVFNVGLGKSTTLLELVALLNELLGTRISPQFEPARTGDVKDSCADMSWARAKLGYEPRVQLREGLAPTITFFKERSRQ